MLGQKEAEQLATRLLQLMESTAVAVPGLIRAAEPVKQNAEMTLTAMQRTPQNPALTYQFMNQVKAYLALSDSIPRPYPFPATADQQYTELREGLQRMQQHFEAILQVQNVVVVKKDTDPNELKHYAEANSKMPPASSLPRVVFLGDSITDPGASTNISPAAISSIAVSPDRPVRRCWRASARMCCCFTRRLS